MIIALSNVLKDIVHSLDACAVGRWGGEEFMIMLPNIDMNTAKDIAEKIRTEFSSISYETAGCQTVSLGVTQAKDDESADTLYTRVDKALYIAKYNGRNQTVQLENIDL